MSSNSYFLWQNEAEHGPFSPQQLKQMAASGQVGPDDHVRKDGEDRWVQASNVKGLMPGSQPATASVADSVQTSVQRPAQAQHQPQGNYHLGREGQTYGPYPMSDLQNMLQRGELYPGDSLLAVGTQQWIPYEQVMQAPQAAPAPRAQPQAPQRPQLPGRPGGMPQQRGGMPQRRAGGMPQQRGAVPQQAQPAYAQPQPAYGAPQQGYAPQQPAYGAPQGAAYGGEGASPFKLGNIFVRFIGMGIDGVLLVVVMVVFFLFAGTGGPKLGPDYYDAQTQLEQARMDGDQLGVAIYQSQITQMETAPGEPPVWPVLVGVMLFYVYGTVMVAGKTRGTLGKMLTGLYVIHEDGTSLSYGQAFGRVFVWNMLAPLSQFVGLFDSRKRGIHDMAASSIVVTKASYNQWLAYRQPEGQM